MKPIELLPGLPTGARILLIRLRRLGDTVLSTPLYTALKNWRPDLRLTVLVETPNDEVLRNNSDLENVITIPTLRKGVLGKFAARWNLRGQIRAARFDCCINLHEGPTSAWLTALSGAPYRAGLATTRNRLTCNVLVDKPRPPEGRRLHTVENQIASLYAMGLPPGPIPPLRLVPDPAKRSGALSQLRRAGLDPDREYVVIHPAANFPSKEWPPERLAVIADEIRLKHGLQVAIVAGPGEEARAELVAKQSRSSQVVVHGVSVAELAWLIHGARLFIGNDSGPTHMAAALKVPIVVMFGSSDSQIWYPWTTKSQFCIVQNQFACNPCSGSRCHVYGEPRCILSITSEQVKTAVTELLKARNDVDPRRSGI